MTKELHKQIVKGKVAEYATSCAKLGEITEQELAKILEEIIKELINES